MLRTVFTFAVGILPAGRTKNWLLCKTGQRVARTARVSPIFLLPGSRIEVGHRASIGPLTAIRGASVFLREGAEIGQLNWISAAPFLSASGTSSFHGQLILDPESSLTNRHYIDASGGVRIGKFTTVAGVRSTFMTHGIDAETNTLITAPIVVGEYCMVGGNCSFVLGGSVPNRSVVGMGAVIVRGLTTEGQLYVGNPARARRPVDLGAYGQRTHGKVPPAIEVSSSAADRAVEQVSNSDDWLDADST